MVSKYCVDIVCIFKAEDLLTPDLLAEHNAFDLDIISGKKRLNTSVCKRNKTFSVSFTLNSNMDWLRFCTQSPKFRRTMTHLSIAHMVTAGELLFNHSFSYPIAS